jgi:hypothetical protein
MDIWSAAACGSFLSEDVALAFRSEFRIADPKADATKLDKWWDANKLHRTAGKV